ncbi:MAG TPA: S9 family peptidase [Kofleriaceae bacterium]|jgi:dipeptidyl aminopeptidase/acylaminoacyl peptidase|nr:S9 family peptidase [Kofleriaceae bacterium]
MSTRRIALVLAVASACGGSPPPAAAPAPPAAAPGPTVATPAPAQPAGVKQYDAATLFKNVGVVPAGFSRDGSKALVAMDASGVYNLYAIPVAGGEPQRLTTSNESQVGVGYFPTDDRVIYSQDGGGNELSHLYVLDGPNARDITPGDKTKATFLRFSSDGAWFWALTNERDPKAFDVYRYSAKDYKRELVFTNKDAWDAADVSRDGRWLALKKVKNNADSDLYLADLKQHGAPKLITAHKGDIQHEAFGFAPSGKTLWYSSDGNGEFTQAWSYDLATGKARAEITAEWDVALVAFSETGRYRVSSTNEDARTVLRVVDTTTGKDVALPALPSADITGVMFSRDDSRMGFVLTSDRTPRDLWVVDLAGGAPRQLTHALNPAVDPDDLVDSQVVRYPSFDGLQIPAILFRPKDASPGHKVPAVVLVHGGPGGQSRRGYSGMTQHLVNHGYAVLAVNNRGSSGYGKKFFHMDDRKHGEIDLKDVVAARPYLAGLDWVDGSRVAIMGGSYGGYMVGAALAFAPDAFDAGIDIFGVMNWVRTLKSIPPWWTSFRDSLYAEMGDPATDEPRLQRISPLFHAQQIKKPLLVVQGKNDPRVLQVESDEIVAAVKKNGVPVEYIVFDDEGHGFRKQKNTIAAQEAYLKFLDTHLRR